MSTLRLSRVELEFWIKHRPWGDLIKSIVRFLINTQGTVIMKIFISHSSKNEDYGRALVDLLTGVGIDHDSIVFTSDTSYGIPVGKNIFNWLKTQISERPFVIYLLSTDYFSSVACLNEMGAAWVVENQHAAIFTPNFDLNDASFRGGALDPREIGFFIDHEDRVTEFIESLRENFKITPNQVVINNKRRAFLELVRSISDVSDCKTALGAKDEMAKENQLGRKPVSNSSDKPKTVKSENNAPDSPNAPLNGPNINLPLRTAREKLSPTARYFQDLADSKLKDEEVMLIHYASETGQHSLGAGWRIDAEVARVKDWEELNELGDTLSTRYEQALRRLDLRNLTEVSEVTSAGNQRQVTIVDEMKERLLDLPEEFFAKSSEISKRALEAQEKKTRDNDFPF